MIPHRPRFLVGEPAAAGALVTLDRDEARHARVRRLARGEAVALCDGAGWSAFGTVEDIDRERVAIRVSAPRPPHEGESPLALTLAIGLLKADKLDDVIEHATELGVTHIQPFASTHTLGHPSAARQARWPAIARGAAKQCGRTVVPAIAAPVAFADVLALPAALRVLLAEHGDPVPLAALAGQPVASVLVVVGAEGGFASAELEAARRAGFHLAGLGPRILRAETAALTACALAQACWGDLRVD